MIDWNSIRSRFWVIERGDVKWFAAPIHACRRVTFLLSIFFFLVHVAFAQESFQKGHTHDILQVRFSSDGNRLASYSAGDGWLCYWDTRTGDLFWKSETAFIQKADEHANIDAFGWNDDLSRLYSRSKNGTFQTWDAKMGRLLSVSETNPDEKAFARTKATIKHDYMNFYVRNSAGEEAAIPTISRTGSTYDLSDDGRLFAEGGSWGNAIIRITQVDQPSKFLDLKGGKILPHVPTELETKLNAARTQRRRELSAEQYERNKQAEIETKELEKNIFIRFDHYGDMKDPGELRIMESSEPDKSREEKSKAEANAAWLRLYNSSPLPIQIPTQSFYLPQPKCSHQFSETLRVPGLCDNAEIAVWFRLQDKNGKPLRYGFDSGSSAVLLPGTSVLFAVPLAILKNDNAITFGFTFQKSDMRNQVSEYGTRKILRFPAKELGRN